MLNGAATFTWNADKAHLIELGALVPVIPTVPLQDRGLAAALAMAIDRWGQIVVKPAVGAGGVGLVVAESPTDTRLEGLTTGPWLAQPLIESIHTHGETSTFVFNGAPVTQINKRPASGEVRVHDFYGGQSHAVPLDPDVAALATSAVQAAGRLLQTDIAYARVDALWHEGRWTVGEIELIEPSLYLDVEPATAAHFADLIADRVRN